MDYKMWGEISKTQDSFDHNTNFSLMVETKDFKVICDTSHLGFGAV